MKQTARKPSVKKMTVALKATEKMEELKTLLEEITFDKINISLSTKKTNIGLQGQGYTSIGFVNKYNKEDKTFDIVIFENKIKAIEDLGDVVIVCRSYSNKDGKLTKITGLDIEPVEA